MRPAPSDQIGQLRTRRMDWAKQAGAVCLKLPSCITADAGQFKPVIARWVVGIDQKSACVQDAKGGFRQCGICIAYQPEAMRLRFRCAEVDGGCSRMTRLTPLGV